MTSPWIAALAALFLWWFSTGAIMVAARRADQSGRHPLRITLLSLPLLILGLLAFHFTRDSATAGAIYGSFLSVLAIWGWVELAFLTGVITGPNPHPCPKGLPEWERFIRAWGTIAYHEMLLAALLVLIWLHGAGAVNEVGLWTFATLYLARVSAKLNLYFGVPRINTEFLPKALGHLASHFRLARLNWIFPISVTGLTAATAWWLYEMTGAVSPTETTGIALVATLTALALLEHWLMVLPLPDAKLWRWMLPAPKQTGHTAGPEGPNGL
ncbi:putative photosynthetic complex assembly protein PuhE [Maritimibacter sp. UBA3975]|uniref:putative photosynthetic complex assembly protein PuhE n=1 Tax=Maritimibacter sp. UBA3975 TaxID=1946833 RepID=UPI000C0A5BFB|nr:putative photosynthetic complex assembly protein PuhE [Maritimibacter sp. UBA3975]MAM62917.1 hypothetical protein [Maritimibacter sp.]|tara:strand:- start:6791 stop:7600 length:810 start_codon:yes stop_codon:yes gene_type:complete